MSHAQVTIPLDELDAMRQNATEMAKRITELQKEVIERRIAGTTDDAKKLVEMIRASIEVVGFAIANLSPEITKRWPHAALRQVADGLKLLPDHSIFDEEATREIHKFADECAHWELKRKNEPEAYIPPPFAMTKHGIAQILMGAADVDQKRAKEAAEAEMVSSETTKPIEWTDADL